MASAEMLYPSVMNQRAKLHILLVDLQSCPHLRPPALGRDQKNEITEEDIGLQRMKEMAEEDSGPFGSLFDLRSI